jgi:hypothetical protein
VPFVGAAVVSGCSGGNDVTTPTVITDDSTLLWSVALKRQAITLAHGDTVQLELVARNARGDVLANAPAPVFVSSTNQLTVTPDGLVTAVGTSLSNGKVVVSVSMGGITKKDSAMINIAATPPAQPLITFSIQPTDSARLGTNDTKTITPVSNLSNLTARWGTSDPGIATVSSVTATSVTLKGISPGKVKVFATTTAYGVTKTDTAEYTILLPNVISSLQLAPYIVGKNDTAFAFAANDITLRLGIGSIVTFTNINNHVKTEVVFDDPTNVKGVPGDPTLSHDGNIESFGWNNDEPFFPGFLTDASKRRYFPVPGTYVARPTVSGASAPTVTIIIVDESSS